LHNEAAVHCAPHYNGRRGLRAHGFAANIKRMTMVKTFDEMQKLAQDGLDATVKSLGAVSQGAQALSAEVSDYAQKTFDDTTSATERLLGARTLESAIAAQSDYLKAAYEGFVTRSTKIGSLYADLAKDAYKPLETYLSKTTPAL
jgi:hypothetical protein